jgi:membrane protease YdiL (CAAX protease family)
MEARLQTHPTVKGAKLSYIFSSILVTFSWIVAAVLIFFLFLIGRFYEIRFGQRSYYQLFLIPLGFFVVAGVWDAFLANGHTGDPLLDFVGASGPDLFFLLGGLALIVLCCSLYRTMMGKRG